MHDGGDCLSFADAERHVAGAALAPDQLDHLLTCEPCRGRLEAARTDAILIREVAAATRGRRQPTGTVDLVPGYQLLEEIHRGGQGIVYRAIHRETKRTVALKLPLAGEMQSAAAQRRFEREIELVAQLRHPNIVTLYDAGKTAAGVPGYAMEYVEGTPLDRFVRQRLLGDRARPGERSEIRAIVRLLSVVAGAVAYAHQRGVIHRDLKPANILIDQAGAPHILDFGLGRGTTAARTLTLDGEFAGTLDYAAPEQFSGVVDAVDLRCDVYSIGVMLYELLTGASPRWSDGNLLDRIQRITRTEPPVASSQNPALDAGINAILARCLRLSPQDRYASAAALQADLENYLADRPLEARAASRWYRLRAAARRNRWLLSAAAASFIVLSTVALAMTLLYRRAELERQNTAAALEQAQLEQARLQIATERIPAGEDALWSALLRSDAPLGADFTDPVFWALLELYAHHPCIRTWPAPAASWLRNLRPVGDNSFVVVLQGGRFLSYSIRSDQVTPIWDAKLSDDVTIMTAPDDQGLYFANHSSRLWALRPHDQSARRLADISRRHIVALFNGEAMAFDRTRDSLEADWISPREMEAAHRTLCTPDAFAKHVVLTPDRRTLWIDEAGALRAADLTTDPPTALWSRHDADPGGGLFADGGGNVVLFQQRPEIRPAFACARTGNLISASEITRTSQLRSVSFDQSGRHAFVIRLNDTAVRQIRVSSAEVVRTLLGHRASPAVSCCLDRGDTLVTGESRGEIKAWTIAEQSAGYRVITLASTVTAVSFDSRGERLLLGCTGRAPDVGGEALVVRAADGEILRRYPSSGELIQSAVWDSQEADAITAGTDGVLRRWSAETSEAVRIFSLAEAGRIHCVARVPNSAWLAAGSVDGVVRLVGEENGGIRALPAHARRVAAIAASPDGRYLAYCGESRRLSVYDLQRNETVFESATAGGVLRAVTFSQDGRLLAVVGDESIVQVYRSGDWTLHTAIQSVQQPSFSLVFRPDGRVLATGDSSGAIMFWDVATGTNLLKLNRHTAPVFSLAYSPDGRVLASGSQDRTLILHNLHAYEAHIAGNLEAALAREPSIANTPRAHALRAWARKYR